ncbi:MAG TPA: hypothetical protein VJM33_01860 [Microthrixaceae bacterium]|nr:hypothetical protein [Microthrixaceae bacterium]
MDTLNVLVIENRPGAGDAAVDELVRGGHHIERCHEPGDHAFPCKGLVDPESCPIHRVDVALSVRHHVTPRPTRLEEGVTCALRAGIAVVEDGPDILDPFEPWLSGRVEGAVATSCERAIEQSLRPLKDRLMAVTVPIARDAGVEPEAISWSVERSPGRVALRARGPALDVRTRSRLAVRALDALRGSPCRRDQVDVDYEIATD